MSTKKRIGELLRKKREEQIPLLGESRKRRTPGLTREEVAERACISAEWYTRLEQGRGAYPSEETIEALALTLNLSSEEIIHLKKLSKVKETLALKKETVPEELTQFIKKLPTPAYLIGARYDVLCANNAAAELFNFHALKIKSNNLVYQMFQSDNFKKIFYDWKHEAQVVLSGFKSHYDFYSNDPEFSALVSQLNRESKDFCQMWNDCKVKHLNFGEKIIVKDQQKMIYQYSTFKPAGYDFYHLVVYMHS